MTAHLGADNRHRAIGRRGDELGFRHDAASPRPATPTRGPNGDGRRGHAGRGGRGRLPRRAHPRPTFQLTRRLVGVPKWPLILLTAVYAVNVSDQYIVPALFPLLKQEFGLSDTALGVLSGSYLVVVTIGTVPFGILADRRRRTRIIAWGTAAWGLTMIWTGLARNYASLLASRMTLGAWDPCDNPTSQSLLADYYPVRQRTKVMGVYQIGSICGIVAVPIAAAMAEQWGWRSAMFFFSIPAFIVAVLAWRIREPVRGEMDRRYGNIEAGVTIPSVYEEMPARQAYGHILRIPTYTSMLVSNGVGALFFGGVGAWLATFLVRYHDMTLSQAATATLVFALGGLIGALSSGQIADYLAFKGMRSARLAVAGVGRVATVPLLLFVFSVPSVGVMLVVFTLGVITLVAPVPPINAARRTCSTRAFAAGARRSTPSCRASAGRPRQSCSAFSPTHSPYGPRSWSSPRRSASPV